MPFPENPHPESDLSHSLLPAQIVGGLPLAGWQIEGPGLHALVLPKEEIQTLHDLTLPGIERFLALHRDDPWFLRPAWGAAEIDVPKTECQLLLWRRQDGLWAVMLPMAQGNRRAWLQGGSELSFCVRGTCEPEEPDQLCLLLIGIGKDPASLVNLAVEAGMRRLQTAVPRTEKPVPAWVDLLGWCTWDAFYHEVTAAKIKDGLRAFAKDELAVPLLIVDDGWQQTKDWQLLSFAADESRFPGGLQAFSASVKTNHGVSMLGVWHALAGYWNGVHPDGELAKRYQLIGSFHGAYNISGSQDLHRSLVHPDDVHHFYADFHGYLQTQGVDMVKVDNQASLDHFTENLLSDGLTVAAYQEGVQDAARKNFKNNLLHCMAMSNDIAWRLKTGAVWRNSQDYFPTKPETQGHHLVTNAANALWSSTFALPDWDMFYSGGEAGWFHGAARAISGGPVYISDKPGTHDAKLLRALTLSNGRVPRPEHPARVADGRILVDCTQEDKLLLIRNETAAGFLLGVFHCRHVEHSITDEWCPADAGTSGKVVVQSFRSQECWTMEAAELKTLTLPPLGWEIFTIVPLVNGIAPLGLEEKLAGAAAISQCDYQEDGSLQIVVRDGGTLRIWSEKDLIAHDVEGNSLPLFRTSDTLWAINVPTGAPAALTVKSSN